MEIKKIEKIKRKGMVKGVLFSLIVLASLSSYSIFPSHGMQVEEEVGSRGKKKTLKTLNNMPITSMSVLAGELKGKDQKKQMEAELRTVAQVFNPDAFDQTPQKDHITPLWEEAAKQGNFAGLYNFGWRLQRKEGEKEILPPMKQKLESYKHSIKGKSFYWWQKAHTSEDAHAWVKLGTCYRLGKGVQQNYQEAMRWYLKAAAQNNAAAQFYIGTFYSKGLGVPKDYDKAMEWYLAGQNHAHAQYSIGFFYHHNSSGYFHYVKAIKWYQLAANQGHAEAQYTLGVLYDEGCDDGDDEIQDDKKAMEWYRLAADQDHVDAQYRLGTLYDDVRYRRGLPYEPDDCDRYYNDDEIRDDKKAIEWYLKAAEQNHADAQRRIFQMYIQGKGGSPQKAFEWFQKAPIEIYGDIFNFECEE